MVYDPGFKFDVSSNRRRNLATLLANFPTKVALAKKLRRPPQQIGGMLNGSKPFGPRAAREFEKLLNLPDGWLDADHSKDSRPEEIDATKQVITLRKLTLEDGVASALDNEFLESLHVRVGWLFSQPVSFENSTSLRIASAPGDEMSPTIKRGDIVLVDTKPQSKIGNGVYAVILSGVVTLCHIQILPNRACELQYDNPRCSPIRIDDLTQIKVLGKCLVAFNARPL